MVQVAVIVGAGSKHDEGGPAELEPSVRWGLGGALSLCFAKGGFHVVLLGRRVEVLEAVATQVREQGGQATAQACDVCNDESVRTAFEVAKALGPIEVVVYNAAPPLPPGKTFTTLPEPMQVDPEFLNKAFDIGVTGCVRCAREVVPGMLERGSGSILLSGATMSLRGGAKFGCLSPVKFALRSLGQSMYQEYAPKGIHVAHVVIDGVIKSPGTLSFGAQVQLQEPAELADAFLQVHLQKPTVWSYEIQLSPNRGSLGQRL